MLHHEVQSGFELEEHQPSSQQQEQQQSVSNNQIAQKQKKKFMPQEYNKAKRTLNKLIVTYFNDLKNEINRGAKLFIDKSRIQGIINAISYFVGVRYEKKNQFLQLNLKTSQQNKVKQQRNGLFSYLAQSQKIINYTQDSRVNVIQIDKGKFKLPNMATPVPFLSNIFLLDPCIFEAKRKVFVPSGPALMIGLDGKLKQVNGIILYRNKCAIVRDKQFIYLLGGYAKQQKILTNRCQKYNPRNGKSQQMINMNFKHKCPTACILNAKIWVFSTNHIEYYQNNQWKPVQLPFGANFLPFQFVFGINQDEILIFGGILNNQKSCQIKIYNLRHNYFMNYGPILPQGICNQRSWGPCMIQGSIGVLSSIQASVYPQIGIKSSMSEVIYIYQSSAYINCILNS